jgi:hypothetical protein
MSSFLVNDACIDTIVQYAVECGVIKPTEALEMCKEIKHANLHALNKRYGDELPAFDDVEHEPDFIEARLDPAHVAKCIRLWNYQCAEPPLTPSTRADELVEHIEAYFEHAYMKSIHDLADPGFYIEDIRHAIAREQAA